ncbi:MAG: lysozyme inhibitor LprI family protein [Candidatus Kapaibacterium sp.]|jgi:uncharacterized protein YecT (DUF1311 family)
MKNIILLFLLIYIPAISQDSTEIIHPIEAEMKICLDLDSNYSTQAMLDCVYIATDSWKLELNKNYNELISKLDDDKKNYLKKSHQYWLVYKENEFKLINEIYLSKVGTMYILMAALDKLKLIKSRALELKEYIDIMNIDE